MSKAKVHFSLFSVCVSFMPACRRKMSYECNGMFGAAYTEKEEEVTCISCKKAMIKIYKTGDDQQSKTEGEKWIKLLK